MIENSCALLQAATGTNPLAYYSHLVPLGVLISLSLFTLIQTKFSKLSILFSLFTFSVGLWLVGDLVAWVGTDYHLIVALWSWLDFLNVVFFIFGAAFFVLVARDKIQLWEKALYLVLALPALFITVTGNAIVDFYQPVCEATNNAWLTNYKLFASIPIALSMVWALISVWNKETVRRRIQLAVLFVALMLFLGVFAGTEYIASTTGVYEINLYGLFVLPLFVIVLTFATTDLRLFQLRLVGTQLSAYILIVLVGSQLLFIQDTTGRSLSLITLAMALFLGLLLIENARREALARIEIETLAKDLSSANDRLKELDQMKSEFLSIASHQLRAPITAVRGYAANINEGAYGPIPEHLREPLETVQESARLMASSIEDYLNISRIEQNRMKYEKSDFDITELAKKVVVELAPVAAKRKLTLSMESSEPISVNADVGKIKQVITNLVDNAIKYTEQGSVTVSAKKEGTKVVVTISDTGIGIPKEEIDGLFEKFKRARGANKVNTTGTGLGLYVAKQLVEGHGGSVRAESDGPGKGSRFIIQL
jgi:signal transduction histidine kinase